MSKLEVKWRVEGGRLIIVVPADEAPGHIAWSEAVRSWFIQSCDQVILDFRSVGDFKAPYYRPLTAFCLAARKGGKRITSTGIRDDVASTLRALGLWTAFNGGREPIPPTPPADGVFLQKFVEAVVSTFATQARVACQPQRPFPFDGTSPASLDPLAIASFLEIHAGDFSGTVALGFPKPTFLSLCSGMLGEEHVDISTENEDLAGELLNIVYGSAKRELNNSHGYDLRPALPTIVRGEPVALDPGPAVTPVIVSITSAVGPFRLEFRSQRPHLSERK